MAQRIDCSRLADALLAEAAAEVEAIRRDCGITPGLAVVMAGNDPASDIYVRRKLKRAREIGLASFEHRLPAGVSESELLALIETLNGTDEVHGILVQLPLPRQIDAHRILDAIDPHKDVDGFHPVNVGRLSVGTGGLVPCTPLACMLALETVIDDFRGLKALVIGKSNIVGKPVALLLLERECTVTVAHIYTRDLPSLVGQADIVVAAAGKAGLVRGAWIKPGAVVIDVGINRIVGQDGVARVVGDVAAEEAGHAGALTPVPGGIGPMTVACLVKNTVKAVRMARRG